MGGLGHSQSILYAVLLDVKLRLVLLRRKYMCHCLGKLIAELWESGNFIESDVKIPEYHYDLPWVPYEDYMEAQLIEATAGSPGRLIVKFPPWTREDKGMHIHPNSDRVILVLEGAGEFVAVRNDEEIRIKLKPGDRVWMPRGVKHNFIAGSKGPLVESQHLPYIPMDDPQCLVRVEE